MIDRDPVRWPDLIFRYGSKGNHMKHSLMKKCIPFLLAVLMLVPQVPVYAGSDEASGRSFEISKESRFYIVSDKEPAEDVLETVKTADQFFAAAKVPSGDPLDIVYGRAKYAAEGDIVIALEGEGEEGETILVN